MYPKPPAGSPSSAPRYVRFTRTAVDSPLRAYVVPGVLLTVGLIQPVLVASFHLSPWKGGGFGMFSTVDQPRLRFVRVQVTSELGTERRVIGDGAPAPGRVRVLADRARALPTERTLAALARAVAEVRLQDAGGQLRQDRGRADTARHEGSVRDGAHIPTMVEVEVHRLRYLRASGVVMADAINRYRWVEP